MTRKILAYASAILVFAMLAIAWRVGILLPADAQLPIHWGLNGQADGFANKWTALLLPPGMIAMVGLLFQFLPALEPRRQGLERSQGLYLTGWASILLVGIVLEIVLVSAALGWALPVDRLIAGSVGIMLVMIGNQLGKSRSMYLVGIRTPWTLASEEVWIRTHRLGGKLMAAAGLLMVLAALAGPGPEVLGGIALGAILLAAFIPVVYSWLLWRREMKAR